MSILGILGAMSVLGILGVLGVLGVPAKSFIFANPSFLRKEKRINNEQTVCAGSKNPI